VVVLDCFPSQEPEVVAALRAAFESPAQAPDPWWQAGLEESLGAGGYGETTGLPRSRRGAERA